MREIKFQIWDKINKRMVPAPALFFPDHHGFFWQEQGGKMRSDLEGELMQYTGLKDRSGKEIYEGDIVKWRDETFVVRYARHLAQFALHQHDSEKIGSNKEWRYEDSMSDVEHYEVIGTIYENPELLQET